MWWLSGKEAACPHHFMNETWVPENCPSGCLGEQVTCLSPASQPSRGFIQTQLLSKTLNAFPFPSKDSLTHDLT